MEPATENARPPCLDTFARNSHPVRIPNPAGEFRSLPPAVVVRVGEGRRDRQCGVSERDLNVAIPLGAPLDEWQGGPGLRGLAGSLPLRAERGS
jgi:hypothetical protein